MWITLQPSLVLLCWATSSIVQTSASPPPPPALAEARNIVGHHILLFCRSLNSMRTFFAAASSSATVPEAPSSGLRLAATLAHCLPFSAMQALTFASSALTVATIPTRMSETATTSISPHSVEEKKPAEAAVTRREIETRSSNERLMLCAIERLWPSDRDA